MSPEAYKRDILPLKDKLYRLALRMLGDAAEAEDAIQEVLIKLWNQRDQLGAIQNLEAWSLRLTKNYCIDKLRSRRRQTESWNETINPVSWEPDPERQAESRDTFDLIRKLMNNLPEKLRLVMQLRDIEGLSYEEITEILEIPLSQVKINLFRARQQMRAYLIKTATYEQ